MNERFSELLRTAEAQLRLHPGAAQVVAVKTVSGSIHWFANSLAPEAEDRFVQSLSAEHAAVALLVCIWSDGSLDLPSMHLRKRLLEADPENEHALMLLQSETCPITRTIRWSMP